MRVKGFTLLTYEQEFFVINPKPITMLDNEDNKITLDFVRFFTELAMIENENSEETSVSADS